MGLGGAGRRVEHDVERGDAGPLLGTSYVGHAGHPGDLLGHAAPGRRGQDPVGSEVPAGKDWAIRSPAAIDSGFWRNWSDCDSPTCIWVRAPAPIRRTSREAAM